MIVGNLKSSFQFDQVVRVFLVGSTQLIFRMAMAEIEYLEIVAFTRFRTDAPYYPPRRATTGAAGIHIATNEPVTIMPQSQGLVNTNLCIQEMKDEGCYIMLKERSGYAKQGVIVVGGVVNEDYDREYFCQAIVMPYWKGIGGNIDIQNNGGL